jgi:hypothetical protein
MTSRDIQQIAAAGESKQGGIQEIYQAAYARWDGSLSDPVD